MRTALWTLLAALPVASCLCSVEPPQKPRPTAPSPPLAMPPKKPLCADRPCTALTRLGDEVLRTGMSRREVIEKLGPPSWVRLPTEREFTSSASVEWDNGPDCIVLGVDIDSSDTVTGWDLGMSCPGAKDIKQWYYHPKPSYSCKKADRRRYCE